MAYIEFTHETIPALKSHGYISCEMIMLAPDDPKQAKIEIVPGKESELKLGMISLKNQDIYQYLNEPSPMAKYVIEESYLLNASTHLH